MTKSHHAQSAVADHQTTVDDTDQIVAALHETKTAHQKMIFQLDSQIAKTVTASKSFFKRMTSKEDLQGLLNTQNEAKTHHEAQAGKIEKQIAQISVAEVSQAASAKLEKLLAEAEIEFEDTRQVPEQFQITQGG